MSDAGYGPQPALRLLRMLSGASALSGGRGGRIAPTARALGIDPRRLARYLKGEVVPPAEIKIGLARLLSATPEECWTPAVLTAVYSGPRGTGR